MLKRSGSACCLTKVFNRSAGDTQCHPDSSSDDAILIHFRIFYQRPRNFAIQTRHFHHSSPLDFDCVTCLHFKNKRDDSEKTHEYIRAESGSRCLTNQGLPKKSIPEVLLPANLFAPVKINRRNSFTISSTFRVR